MLIVASRLNVADQNSTTKYTSGATGAKALKMAMRRVEESGRHETNFCLAIQSKLFRAG
jgi:hypothetical protein